MKGDSKEAVIMSLKTQVQEGRGGLIRGIAHAWIEKITIACNETTNAYLLTPRIASAPSQSVIFLLLIIRDS